MAGGKRGPPPTPTKILKERGSWRGKTRQNEPELKPEEPDCPKWLPKEAKEEWKRIVPILMEMKILTKADRVCLENYCLAYGRAVKMQAFIDKNGYSYETVTGWRKYPEVAILEQAQQLMRAFLQEFGLSPASRTRVAATQPDEGELPKDEGFFKKRGKPNLKVV